MKLRNLITLFTITLIVSMFTACGSDDENVSNVTLGEIYKELSVDNIVQVENHADGYILTSNGEVYKIITDYEMEVVNGLTNIKKISMRDSHLLALDNNGEVFGFGSNNNGELGLGTFGENDSTEVRKLSLDFKVTDIATGNIFSFIVSEDGDVYSFGYGGTGNLGHGNEEDYNIPTKITSLSGISKVYSSDYNTIALSQNGDIYSWGIKSENGNSILGLGEVLNQSTPSLISDLASGISDVSIGSQFTLLLGNDENVYGFGDGSSGQLGNSDLSIQKTPVQINGLSNIKQVSAGSNHSLFLNNSGDVYSTGDNSDESKLGYGNNNYGKYDLYSATKVPNISDISYMNAGDSRSIYVNTNGKAKVSIEQSVTYPVSSSSSSSSACSDVVGNWTRSNGDTVNIYSTCTATIKQYSYDVAGYIQTTKISNIVTKDGVLSYSLNSIGMTGEDTVYYTNKNLTSSYSVSGNTLVWGSTYTK